MIQLENVCKIYPTRSGEVRALDEVSLQVASGQFVAVCGHSGCGKSTLLSLIGGLSTPTRGRVVVGGQVISQLSSAERACYRAEHVGFVFQMFHLLPYLSVRENVLVALPRSRHAEAGPRADELLEQFGLQHRLAHRPGQLSAGERQRVAMARALMNRPDVLLADEPTGNLDPQNASSLLELLSDFHQAGGTVVLATHDEVAASHAERVMALQQGRLIDANATFASATRSHSTRS